MKFMLFAFCIKVKTKTRNLYLTNTILDRDTLLFSGVCILPTNIPKFTIYSKFMKGFQKLQKLSELTLIKVYEREHKLGGKK